MLAESGGAHRRALVFALFGVGCAAEPASTTLEAPDELLYVAAVSRADGRIVSASSLVRWSPGEGLPLFVDPTLDHVLVGYSAAALADLAPLDESALSVSPLRAASGCEPPLPTPTWKATWTAGENAPQVAGDSLVVPALTAEWMQNRCPVVADARWMVETSCNDFAVFPTVTPSETPCTKNLTLTTYRLPTLKSRLWYDGRVCAEPAEGNPECSRDPALTAGVSCAGNEPCELVAGLNDHSMPPFTAMTSSFMPGAEPYRDRYFEDTREYRASRTMYGWGRDLVVLEDRIWVLAYEMPAETCPWNRVRYEPSVLVRLDPDSLAPVGTATAPPCMTQLLEDVRGGFVATYAEAESNWLARYDRDGRQVERRLLGQGPQDPVSNVQLYQVLGLERLRSGELAVLITDIFNTENNLESKLVFLDGDTLVERRRLESLGIGLGHFLVQVSDDELAIAFESTNAIQYVDIEGPSLTRRVAFEHDPGVGTHGLGFRNGELFYAAYSLVYGFQTDSGRELWSEPVSARPMVLIRATPWPTDPNLIAIFGMSPRQYFPLVTLVSFLDRRTGHFLPGVYETGGLGVPHVVSPDGRGGFLVLQPWGAQVTRITPKNP